jgi:hypothetical protein
MRSKFIEISSVVLRKIKGFFDNNDIRSLTFVPPILAFGFFISFFFLADSLSEKPVPESYLYIIFAIACFIECIAGAAQIYKREMPGPVGKIIKGNMAVVSGLLILVFFCVGGVYFFMLGVGLF